MPFLGVSAPRKKNLDAVIRSSAGRSATLATNAFACRWALKRMHQDLKSEGNCRRARYSPALYLLSHSRWKAHQPPTRSRVWL